MKTRRPASDGLSEQNYLLARHPKAFDDVRDDGIDVRVRIGHARLAATLPVSRIIVRHHSTIQLLRQLPRERRHLPSINRITVRVNQRQVRAVLHRSSVVLARRRYPRRRRFARHRHHLVPSRRRHQIHAKIVQHALKRSRVRRRHVFLVRDRPELSALARPERVTRRFGREKTLNLAPDARSSTASRKTPSLSPPCSRTASASSPRVRSDRSRPFRPLELRFKSSVFARAFRSDPAPESRVSRLRARRDRVVRRVAPRRRSRAARVAARRFLTRGRSSARRVGSRARRPDRTRRRVATRARDDAAPDALERRASHRSTSRAALARRARREPRRNRRSSAIAVTEIDARRTRHRAA